jgi:hypothetical protein
LTTTADQVQAEVHERPLAGITDKLANAYKSDSLSGRARARRWTILAQRFPDIREMRVLDLGGDVRHWEQAPLRPAEVVVVNLFEQQPAGDWMQTVVGDACEPPASLRRESFDLVYSNSVIEHVGGHFRRLRFAASVRELAERHWVQTPYRHFPLEPHWLYPGLQWLPTAAKAQVTRRWPIGWEHALWRAGRSRERRATPAARDDAVSRALWVELLSVTEMRHYFPRSDIVRERFGALTKSLIAVGGAAT